MRLKLVSCLVVVGALALAACGGDDDDTASTGTTAGDNGSTTTEASSAALVKTGSTSLGDVLVTADGMTVYAFLNDKDGKPTCTGGCADAWPAVAVQGDQLPAGLDSKIFSVAEGADESYQLAADNQPLYTFSGDKAPGDVNGQGTGDVWFVVKPDGTVDKGDAASSGGAGATTTTMGGTTTTADNGY